MARTKNNTLLKNVHGSVGELVVKQYAYGTVITKKPDMSKVKKSESQKKEQNNFKDAVAYAQTIIRNKETKAAYALKLKKGETVYHAAIREYLKQVKK